VYTTKYNYIVHATENITANIINNRLLTDCDSEEDEPYPYTRCFSMSRILPWQDGSGY